jgi:glycosyltransferase involved in cell wall biosynthesis
MAPLFSHRLIAKYATQWLSYPDEPWTWRLQRKIMSSFWWRGPVTVYGNWPNQPKNIVPFFTSILTDEQIIRARSAAVCPRDPDVFRILFVGRLSTSKNVDILLRAISLLKISKRKVECRIIGEGPERPVLQKLAAQLGIENQITFTGGLGFEDVLEHYEQANALVLASDVEGWPKAIAEGMAFGLVCIGTERGMMPQMLGDGRGMLVPPRNAEAMARALQQIMDHPNESREMATRAAAWSQKYSLDGLREALRQLMSERWNLPTEIIQPIEDQVTLGSIDFDKPSETVVSK